MTSPSDPTPAVSEKGAPDFDWIDAPDGKLYEVVGGKAVEKRTSFYASCIATQIAMRLMNVTEPKRAGYVVVRAPLIGFSGRANHHRRPDVSYVSRLTLPAIPAEGHLTNVVPDLVAEVISPHDTAVGVEMKIQEYLAAGVKVVWVVYPEPKVVRVHHADGTMKLLNITGTLDGATALPGFTCVVADLFPKS